MIKHLQNTLIVSSMFFAFMVMINQAAGLDRNARLNHIQLLATHNSYHIQPKEPLFSLIKQRSPRAAASIAYTHAPLTIQLDRGIRGFELDVFYTPKGFQVKHASDFDIETTCPTFIGCLKILRSWSLNHPNHAPIVVLVETKEGKIPQGPTPVWPVTTEALARLDREVYSILDTKHLIRPDDIRGDNTSLEQAVLKNGWPALEDCLGKIIFALHPSTRVADLYAKDRPSLQGRAMFSTTQPGRPDAAIIVKNNPFDESIPLLAQKGYIIRTRADAGLHEAKDNDTRRREKALSCGAHVITTDFPTGQPHPQTGYIVELPNKQPVQANPVTAPQGMNFNGLDCYQPKIPKRVALPKIAPKPLKSYASLGARASIEPSGLVKSRLWDGVYWTQNDSGDIPRIFPHDRNGNIMRSERYDDFKGVRIPDAVNVDWEDIATDNDGHIIIGDFGNSGKYNNRRDLCLYYILEPHPFMGQTSVFKKIFFRYPDQNEIPPPKRNFDSESLFWANNHAYILTKHRSDTYTKLYRLDSMDTGKVNSLTFLDMFDIHGKTTAADASPDGTRLVVTTYQAIWLFEALPGTDHYFDGKISWMPMDIGQCEAVCFDDEETLLLSSDEEKGDLYAVKLDGLIRVQE